MGPLPRQAFFYDDFQGIERFRKALASMLMQTFMKVARLTSSFASSFRVHDKSFQAARLQQLPTGGRSRSLESWSLTNT